MNHLKEIVKKNKGLVTSYIVLGGVIAFLNNFSANYFQRLIDQFTEGTLSAGTIIQYGVALCALCILQYTDEYPGRKLEHGIYLDLKIKALDKMSRIDYQTYQTLGTGRLVQRVEHGASAGKGILFDYYFCLVRQLIPSIVFGMLFIYQISQSIMYGIIFGYIVVFVITKLLLKALYRVKELILSNEEKLNHYLVRGFMEMVVFRLNKRFPSELRKAGSAKKEIVDAKVKMTLIHESFFTIFALLVTFIKIGIIGYGWITRSISIGGVIALIALIDNAYNPIAIFNVLFVQYKLDKTAFRRYVEFIDSENDKQLELGKTVTQLIGSITLDDLTFQYNDRVILNQVNLRISQGDKVALVGESGSGKSTIIKLLTGLLKPTDGEIRIDENPISEICLDSYYDHVSYISQESPIFDGTLKENLVFDSVADNKILEVLEKVHLLELYRQLENGLDTQLGERGITLSGGERQRLALARLWFKQTDLIILDEATSAMDNLTEEYVMDQVMELLRDKTVIVIAHRLNSINYFEKIIALKEGTIIGQGTFDELIEKNDYFQELYRANVER